MGRIAGSYGNSISFYLFEKPQNCFPEQLNHFTFLSAMYEVSNFSTFLLILFIFNFCYSHAGWCEVVLYYNVVAHRSGSPLSPEFAAVDI